MINIRSLNEPYPTFLYLQQKLIYETSFLHHQSIGGNITNEFQRPRYQQFKSGFKYENFKKPRQRIASCCAI